jgi:endonuclease YncB( thermonuclease family)
VDVLLAGRATRIRLAGIDTAETGPRAKCENERALGKRATAEAAALLPIGAVVEIIPAPGRDPYRRTLARITIRGVDVANEMVRRGLARPYTGRGPKPSWCS